MPSACMHSSKGLHVGIHQLAGAGTNATLLLARLLTVALDGETRNEDSDCGSEEQLAS